MERYLLTHSLMYSWLYAVKEPRYESDRDPYAEFMLSLERKPTPTTEAMQDGIDFEDMVTGILNGQTYPDHAWLSCAHQVADTISGSQLQYKVQKQIAVDGMDFLLYGRLDALRAGTIYDIKFSKSYERGKYLTSTQHPTYLELIPEAYQFTYIISDGRNVWTETYAREETCDVRGYIHDFTNWLDDYGLMDTYKQHWIAS